MTICCSLCWPCSTNNCFDFRLLQLVDCNILNTALQCVGPAQQTIASTFVCCNSLTATYFIQPCSVQRG